MTPEQQKLIDVAAEAYGAALVKGAANPYIPALEAAVTVALRASVEVAKNSVHQECCGNLLDDGTSPPECCGIPTVTPMHPHEVAANISSLIPEQEKTNDA